MIAVGSRSEVLTVKNYLRLKRLNPKKNVLNWNVSLFYQNALKHDWENQIVRHGTKQFAMGTSCLQLKKKIAWGLFRQNDSFH